MINCIMVPYHSFKNKLAVIKGLEREMRNGEKKEWIDIHVDDEKEIVVCKYNDLRVEEDRVCDLIQMDRYNLI